MLKPVDQMWLADRFRVAAVRRYGRLEGACDDQLPFSAPCLGRVGFKPLAFSVFSGTHCCIQWR